MYSQVPYLFFGDFLTFGLVVGAGADLGLADPLKVVNVILGP